MPIYKKVNKKFFKKWTFDMAYVLGFFAADGYITKNKRGACFWNIQINDKELLEEIRRVVGSEHTISIKKRGLAGEKISYRLQIGSKEMYEDLLKLGMKQNKTKSLAVPNVPDMFLPSFTRGYFDGDGHVWCGLIHKNRPTSTLAIHSVFTSASARFLKSLKDRLEKKGIKPGVLSKGNGQCYRLVYSIRASLNLCNFMYNNLGSQKLFLPRKKAIFERYKSLRV